jgi:hypothetical protein
MTLKGKLSMLGLLVEVPCFAICVPKKNGIVLIYYAASLGWYKNRFRIAHLNHRESKHALPRHCMH